VTFVITKTNKDDVFASFSIVILWTMASTTRVDGATDDNGENGDGAIDDDVNKDGNGDGATV